VLYVAKSEIKLGVGEYPIRLGKIRDACGVGLGMAHVSCRVGTQSKEVTRRPPELVQHFRL
jgi:hypothetical protein